MTRSSADLTRRPGSFAERHARAKARQLIEALGVERPEHIRVEDIAWTLGLRVVTGGLTGAAARLSVREDRGIIRIRQTESGTTRGRFSVAHEVGHFVLHQDRIKACTEEDLLSLHTDGRAEAQANIFASELLVPESLCRGLAVVPEPDLSTARAIAETFDVGLTAAALRLVELSPEPCGVLFVGENRIRWFRRGEALRARLNVTGPPHRDSLVARVARQGPAAGPEVVDIGCWLEDDDDASISGELTEDVAIMPSVGGFLVFLHLALAEDGEE